MATPRNHYTPRVVAPIQIKQKRLRNTGLWTTPKAPLVVVKLLKWDIVCNIIDNGCAYAFITHVIQLKRTHCQTIGWVKWCETKSLSPMHTLWLRDAQIYDFECMKCQLMPCII